MLDSRQQKLFIEFYTNEIDKKDSHTFHAFERTDFYSIHEGDIDIALKTSLKSSFVVKKMKDENIEMRYVTLNKTLFERLIRELLLVHLYRVEVYSCKKDEYSLAYKGSSGNLIQFENLLLNSSNESEVISNILVSLQLSSSSQHKVILIH